MAKGNRNLYIRYVHTLEQAHGEINNSFYMMAVSLAIRLNASRP